MSYDASGSDWMNAAAALALGAGDFAVSAWHQDVSGTAGIRTIGAAGTSRAELRANGSGNPGFPGMLVSAGLSRTFTDLTYDLGAPTWRHYVVARTSAVLRGYLNGVLSATTHASLTNVSANGTASVGATPAGANQAFGPIEDFAIWIGRALTAAEILAMFTNRWRANAYPAGLALHWKLNGTSGAIQTSDPGVQDASGNARHIVALNGTPQWSVDSPGLIDVPARHKLLWRRRRPAVRT